MHHIIRTIDYGDPVDHIAREKDFPQSMRKRLLCRVKSSDEKDIFEYDEIKELA